MLGDRKPIENESCGCWELRFSSSVVDDKPRVELDVAHNGIVRRRLSMPTPGVNQAAAMEVLRRRAGAWMEAVEREACAVSESLPMV